MKTISFLISIALILFVSACEKNDQIIHTNTEKEETVRLNIAPKWGYLEVETKSAAELGKIDLYCWAWGTNYGADTLIAGFPQKQSSIVGSDYQYHLPKISQRIMFTNINSADTSDFHIYEEDVYFKYKLKDKGYSNTEMVFGSFLNLNASEQLIIDTTATLIRSMAKVEILLRIKNDTVSMDDAAGFIKRIWFTMNSFYGQINTHYGWQLGYYEPQNSIIISKNAVPFSEIPTRQDDSKEVLYEIFSGYVFPTKNSYNNSPDVTIEFESFSSSNPLKLTWKDIKQVEPGETHKIILEIPYSEFPLSEFPYNGENIIDSVSNMFPDRVFRNYVLTNFDADKDGQISRQEAEAVTVIEISKDANVPITTDSINSLEGIEYFTNLDSLTFNGICDNQLTNPGNISQLDLSQNTALTYLNCKDNKLSQLDLSNNTALIELNCSETLLTELDLSNNTALKRFEAVWSRSLSQLNVTKNTALTHLECWGCPFAELNVSNNTALTYLKCGYNDILTELDISKNTVVTELNCTENSELTTIWVWSGFDKESDPKFAKDSHSAYQVKGEEDGETDFTDSVSVMFPDTVFRNYVLTNFDADKNGKISKQEAEAVTEINISNDAEIPITTDSIASLKGVEFFVNLERLTCVGTSTMGNYGWIYNSKLTELDVSENTALSYLYCNANQLTVLNVTQNTALTHLNCGYNKLTELDVSQNTALISLDCIGSLTRLDVSQNTALTSLDCRFNEITELDVTQNTALTDLNCSYTQLTKLDVTKNIALSYLVCGASNLTRLDVSQNTALRYLICHNNNLTQLDVTKNTALGHLKCDFNEITELDISKNIELWSLLCENNQLTTLNLSTNVALSEFNSTDNPNLATIWVWSGFDKESDPKFAKDSHSEYKVFGEVATITAEAVAGGDTLSLDLGSVVDLGSFAWDIAGVTVSHKVGTTYDFVVPANQSEGITASSWKKLVVNENSIDEVASSESDPDAHPTVFGVGASARQFIGTIDGALRVEITQKAGSAVEYLGRYGSPLTSSEKALAENAGHTRKRALISTSDAPNEMQWGGNGVTTNITNKWDGLANTASLVALGSEYKAASYCSSLGKGWYLPAQNQLAGAWVVHSGLTDFMSSSYWSSAEYNSNSSRIVDFGDGGVYNNTKDTANRVRCIRDL